MEMRRGQQDNKEIKMATSTLGSYNLPTRDSSSSSPTLAQRSSDLQPSQAQASQTLIFNNDPPHVFYPPQHHQSQVRPTTTDPDLTTTSSPIATTTTRTVTATVIAAAAPPSTRVWYRECQRNHAASMGSHVVDGCGEFMPSGVEGTPESLKCAACECHRNFHRKEVEGEQQQHQQHVPNYHHHTTYYHPNKHNSNGHHLQFHSPPSSSHHHRFSHVLPTTPTVGPVVPPLMMAFGGGPTAESSSEDLNLFQCNAGAQALSVQTQVEPLSKKRFRTKFSQQQKERMMEFAEKLGWRIQKHDDQEVQQFCSQVGIKRQVFKVWMHNNKQAMKKQQM